MKLRQHIAPLVAMSILLSGCGAKSTELKETTETYTETTTETATNFSDDNFFERSDDTEISINGDGNLNLTDPVLLSDQFFILNSPDRERIKNAENDWVKEAEYITNVQTSSYTLLNGRTIDANDIKVPFINIAVTSEEINKINDSFKSSYESAIEFYNNGYVNKDLQYLLSDYECYTNNNIGSLIYVINALEVQETPEAPYLNASISSTEIYNFDLNDGSILTYSYVLEALGLDRDYVDNQICEGIKYYTNAYFDYENFLAEEYSKSEDYDNANDMIYSDEAKEACINRNIEKYHFLEKKDKLDFYIDNTGKLNVLVPYYSYSNVDGVTDHYLSAPLQID